jgi:hypothetical protein
MDDVLLVSGAEHTRKDIIKKAEGLAVGASAEYVGDEKLDPEYIEDGRKVRIPFLCPLISSYSTFLSTRCAVFLSFFPVLCVQPSLVSFGLF